MDRLKWLIDRKATGKPKDLARSLEVSERTLYRLVNDMEDLHEIEITYSRLFNSYVIRYSDSSSNSKKVK